MIRRIGGFKRFEITAIHNNRERRINTGFYNEKQGCNLDNSNPFVQITSLRFNPGQAFFVSIVAIGGEGISIPLASSPYPLPYILRAILIVATL